MPIGTMQWRPGDDAGRPGSYGDWWRQNWRNYGNSFSVGSPQAMLDYRQAMQDWSAGQQGRGWRTMGAEPAAQPFGANTPFQTAFGNVQGAVTAQGQPFAQAPALQSQAPLSAQNPTPVGSGWPTASNYQVAPGAGWRGVTMQPTAYQGSNPWRQPLIRNLLG